MANLGLRLRPNYAFSTVDRRSLAASLKVLRFLSGLVKSLRISSERRFIERRRLAGIPKVKTGPWSLALSQEH